MRGKAVTSWGVLILAAAAVVVVSCGGKSEAGEEGIGDSVVSLGPENIALADSTQLESGPIISGSLEPDREADIRSEVVGTVLQIAVEPGQPVGKGTLLVRIQAEVLRENVLSAQSALRTAEAGLAVATRNRERAERLAEAGALAERELETARWDVMNAEASVADAKARLSNAQRQLGNTEIRAPFTGIVSARPADVGDVVQLGTALVTVVDPASMRLEATVPAERLKEIRVGAPVTFTVNGYAGRLFSGAVERINPSVDPATRQVRIYVRIPNAGRALVAGLFAEGRISSLTRTGVVVPKAAVDARGLRPVVTLLKAGRIHKVEVELGLEDTATERIEILRGVATGDTIVLGAAQGIAENTPARVRSRAELVDTTVKQ
jgi:membrane fusion protein (multidrug efflux system)